jgi:outer membrane protein OmpA-like peptidoglycan-associated protein
LPQDAIKINSYTLDIIGKRLKESRTQDLTITGTTDSKESKTNKILAKERADFAKNYLVANYGADPSKITIIAGSMPTKPSSKSDPEGEAENRRAEFSGNSDVLKPIMISGEKDRVTSPQIVDFQVKYTTDDNVANYTLKYFQAGTLINQIDGTGMPNNISWQISPNQLLAKQVPVDWEFTSMSESGLTKTLNGSIPVDYFSFSRKKSENLPDKVVSKYSLVLFDFDSPVISEQDKQIIEKNVIPAITANSTVQIYGYTDRIGEADYNKKLAQQRADNVKEYLAGKVKNVKFETFGVGESVQIYNNNYTTGRQLSRTVQIYVITPNK